MKRVGITVAALAVLALIVLGVGLALHHHQSAPARGDRDKAADCWAHPDAHGRRHCAT